MKYFILALLSAFVLVSCQTLTSKKQGQKGQQKVDEWFGMQSDSGKKPAPQKLSKWSGSKPSAASTHRKLADRHSGDFICIDHHNVQMLTRQAATTEGWLSHFCDPDKVVITTGKFAQFAGLPFLYTCCVKK